MILIDGMLHIQSLVKIRAFVIGPCVYHVGSSSGDGGHYSLEL
jgi:hypothetical protein